jgi:hypothetical protein
MAGELLADLDLGYAIVRVHAGERTEEERKEALINAGKRFAESIIKSGKNLNEVCSVRRDSNNPDTVNTSGLERSKGGEAQRSGGKRSSKHNGELDQSPGAYIF